MATSSGNMEEEFLTCNICYDVFREPKTLTCLHRFCEQCLHNYIIGQKTPQLIKQGGFHCPTCRELIQPVNARRPPSDWASLLKTDFHLKNLIAFVETQSENKSKSHLASKHVDHPCSEHRNKERDLFCVDCVSVICHLCAGISHRGCSQVISLDEAAADRRAMATIWTNGSRKKLKEIASLISHREKYQNEIERQRRDVESRIKAMGQLLRKNVTKAEEVLVKSLDNQYKRVQDKMYSQARSMEERLAKVKTTIESHSKEIKSLSDFELLSGEMANKMSTNMNVQEKEIEIYRAFLQEFAGIKFAFQPSDIPEFTMGLVWSNIDEVHAREVSSDKTSMLDKLKGVKSKILPTHNNAGEPSVMSERQNVPNTNVSITTNKQQLLNKQIGKISFSQRSNLAPSGHGLRQKFRSSTICLATESQTTNASSIDRSAFRNQGYSKDDTQINDKCPQVAPTPFRRINCRLRNDEHDPKLRDVIVVSPNNAVVVTDWANQSVKAIYLRADKNNFLPVGGRPWAVTQLSDNACAVSLPLSQQICILRITPTLMMQNSFFSAKKYCGLAALSSTRLVASGNGSPPSVDIINLYGEVLKSIVNDPSGSPLFVYPAYVCVSPTREILVSDRKRAAVICMSHTGEVRYTFCPETSRSLQEPSGVMSLPSGGVLVVESRGVLCLTAEGRFSHPMVKPGDNLLCDPRGVAADSEGKIYVTSHDDTVVVLTQI